MKLWQIIGKQNIEFSLSDQFIKNAIKNCSTNHKCHQLHGGTCYTRFGMQFFRAWDTLYKIYLIAHIVQFLFYRAKKAHKNPSKQLYDFLKGFIKSMLFSAGYSVIGVTVHCNLVRFTRFNAQTYALSAGLAGISLVFEPRGRQTQIALFTCKTAIQTVYNQLKRRGLAKSVKGGECILAGLVLSVLAFYFQNHKQGFRRTYVNLIDRIIGQHKEEQENI